jgi:hypothetical protein
VAPGARALRARKSRSLERSVARKGFSVGAFFLSLTLSPSSSHSLDLAGASARRPWRRAALFSRSRRRLRAPSPTFSSNPTRRRRSLILSAPVVCGSECEVKGRIFLQWVAVLYILVAGRTYSLAPALSPLILLLASPI